MKTKTNQYVQNQQTSQQCKPPACDIPPFCRNNYFTGKLLTERDLTAEQRYLTDKLRLHHLALHGWGVICGLKVRSHPHCPELKVVVEPGLAIDPCGRFIRVLKPMDVDLPKPIPKPGGGDSYPRDQPSGGHHQPGGYGDKPTNQGGYAGQSSYNADEPQNYSAPQRGNPQSGGDTYGESPYGEYQDQPPQTQPTVNLYVCLAYAESEEELMPAPFDECACTDSGMKPNRICETYTITVDTEEPDGLDKLRERYECDEDDCLSMFDVLVDPCPAPFDLKCLPLAIVKDHVLGDAVTEDRIDYSLRPALRSTQFLEQIIRCVAKRIPTRTLTQIEDISWTHQGEYHCHDFMRQFIGDDKSPRGFEITFGSPIRREGLNRRTFQATVVRYADASGAGQMELVPSRVRLSNDRRKAFLEIDPRYAQRRLDRTRFDLYLKLRCGLILDDNGLAVDGDLLARLDDDGNYGVATPTGDGIPGGLFESWIRVTTETRG
jgi:hypothetical protein